MTEKERTVLLARYNLEVTLAELDRCKQAIRDGTIWRLAERRSHQHPALREAFLWLSTSPHNAKFDLKNLEELVLDDRDAAKDTDHPAGKWEDASTEITVAICTRDQEDALTLKIKEKVKEKGSTILKEKGKAPTEKRKGESPRP